MEQFEKRCCGVLQSADRLLDRYPRLRRRPGPSLAGRILYPCLPMLRGLEELLPSEECRKLQVMEEALSERLALLKQRRIPLCPALRRFQSQCRELMLTFPEVPGVWDSPSVLVGALRSPHQLDICRECGFYHVPACRMPIDWMPIDYVAIYQSQSLFQEDCGVYCYGRVKRCIPVHRWQIHEIPKNSNELYYRLEVDSWEQLEPPIAIKEIPVIHLLTNLFLLTHSRETPELALKTPAHYVYYQALKASLTLGDGTVLRHPGGVVRLKNGLFLVHRHGRRIAAFRAEDFTLTPSAIFHELMSVLEKKS